MGVIEEILGVILAILVMVDIFLQILYARANKTPISTPLANFLWRFMVKASKPLGHSVRELFLTFSGPIILVTILTSWALLLSIAVALFIQPNLGTGIQATQGATPTDFITALYVGGTSLSFIGASDFVPRDSFFRLFDLLTSLLGVSLVSLNITYLMQLYTSLQSRNTLGLKVHLHTRETGDAAVAVAELGPQGMFDAGYQILAEWAAETVQVKESHHFYPILFYFRFRETHYSVSQRSLTTLDTISLIKSVLDEKEFGWLRHSAAVEELWNASMLELKTLAKNFIPDANVKAPPDLQKRTLWQRRYEAAVERIKKSGIKTRKDGAEEYISLRSQWDGYITQLAPRFAFDMDEIDPTLARLNKEERGLVYGD
jgi:hypothetical protein